MQCSCGGFAPYHEHPVKTLAKAQEWVSSVTPEDLPVTISHNRCQACGRVGRIYAVTTDGTIKRR